METMQLMHGLVLHRWTDEEIVAMKKAVISLKPLTKNSGTIKDIVDYLTQLWTAELRQREVEA